MATDLTEQQAQAYREIKTEFETRKRQLAAQMKAREEELCDMVSAMGNLHSCPLFRLPDY